MKICRRTIFLLFCGLIMATGAQAALFRVGPNDVPSPPGNGYPFWYQDTAGLALDLCIPDTTNQFTPCLIAPLPGQPLPTLPFSFPDNWLDEFFWFGADATLAFDANNSAILVQALEGAFSIGPPAAGDQISFGRIRIRVDAPVDGTYTITYPYGEQIFPDVVAGIKAINFTSDIGIGAPGEFTGALQSAIGPFLTPVDATGGALAPVLIDGSFFLTDGVTPVQVTGSPFGTNFFQVCVSNNPQGLGLDGNPAVPGVNDCMQTDAFTVIGKVHQGAIGSPLAIDRATYARDPAGAQVDVYATASPGPGAPPPVLFIGDAAGTDLMPSALMNGPTGLGQYYGQSVPGNPGAIPAAVIVTNVTDIPPSSLIQPLVDEVLITQADYDTVTGVLTISATSSDKGDGTLILPPQLFAIGLPGSLTGSDQLTTPVGTDPAALQGTFTIPPFGAGPVPPFTVTVVSTMGGQDTEFVTSAPGGVFAAGGPVAVDDNVSVEAGTAASVAIPVLQNDSVDADPTTVVIVGQGANGTAAADPVTGVVTFTFTNNLLIGDDTFTYTVLSSASAMVSNVATVTVTTTGPAGGPVPIAVDDGPFSVQVNGTLPISAATLTANDSGNGGTIDPTSIQIVAGSVTGGTATVDPATGDVTYTAGGVTGNFGFSYTVANLNGQVSAPAAVAVTVVPAADVLAFTQARFRGRNLRWDLAGTSTVPGPGNLVTVRLVRTGEVIATIAVDALGNWTIQVVGSNVIAVSGDQVAATSTAGGSAVFPVQVRQ